MMMIMNVSILMMMMMVMFSILMMISFEFVTSLCIEISREDSENKVNLMMPDVINE